MQPPCPIIGELACATSPTNIDFLLDDTPTDLINQRIDLALRIGIATGSGFTARRLAPNAMILAASPAYLERRPAPRTLHALAERD
jgi:DNA-binding transcriptional LysR family regulator